jgi:murein DD-endopeptidase MepM/ murein hydrolase activator NlpD
MRILFILTIIMVHFSEAVPAQAMPLQVSDSVAVCDSSFTIKNSSGNVEKMNMSVFDIFWETNSIKSGWKTGDTAMIGEGLEPCDTAFPFIMPVNGKLWRGCSYYHAGWDIGVDAGTPVRAGLDGKVRYSRYCSGYGNLVIIRHYSGLEVYYAHLSKIKVTTGQFVQAGDTIGLSGATGHTRGAHLHMEFRICDRALDIADIYKQNDSIVNLYKIKDILSEQSKPQTAEYYAVVRGDNLSAIARRYNTSVSNLCTINHISRESTLRIGQRIRIW